MPCLPISSPWSRSLGPSLLSSRGDVQAFPLSYPSIANAVQNLGWNDPLNQVELDGQISRPNTYSRDSAFSGEGDGCSSIDMILLNQPAFFALQHCEVVETVGRQHRPIKCQFHWQVLAQFGYVQFKTAPIDVSEISHSPHTGSTTNSDPTTATTSSPWDHTWETKFQQTQDPDLRWTLVNDFCAQTLLQCGGKWGQGPRERAAPPRVVAKQICPVQHANHCAATRRSSILFKLQARIDELFIRRTRGLRSDQDSFVFHRTFLKVTRALQELRAPVAWPDFHDLSLTHIQSAKMWISGVTTTTTKNARIKQWKDRVKQSAKAGCTYIFQHLKNRLLDEPPNIVQDDQGNIIYQPYNVLTTNGTLFMVLTPSMSIP